MPYKAQPTPPQLQPVDNTMTNMLLSYFMGSAATPNGSQYDALAAGQGPLSSAAATDWTSNVNQSLLDPTGFNSSATFQLLNGGGYTAGSGPGIPNTKTSSVD